MLQVYAMETKIERHTIGALVTSSRTYLECSKTVIKHSRRTGMHVLGGARANLASSTIASNGDTGCFAQHANSTVLARDCVFTGNGTSGTLVSVGACMHLFECKLTENRIAGAQSTVRPSNSPANLGTALFPSASEGEQCGLCSHRPVGTETTLSATVGTLFPPCLEEIECLQKQRGTVWPLFP
jgi:hypothetical protein